MSKFAVISIGLNATEAQVKRCMASVLCQRDVEVRHVIVDVTPQIPRLAACENLYNAVKGLDKETIVACVDLDDYLHNPLALKRVQDEYDNGAWMTHGSFSDFECVGAYGPGEDFRTSRWRLSHLKTFKAGLFQKIPLEYLKLPDGSWDNKANDRFFMPAMAELAGHERIHFIPDILYVYDRWCSAWNADTETEQMSLRWSQQMKPLTKIESY